MHGYTESYLVREGPIMRHPPVLPTPVIPLSTTDICRCATILILVGQSAFTTQTFQLGDHICFEGGEHDLKPSVQTHPSHFKNKCKTFLDYTSTSRDPMLRFYAINIVVLKIESDTK